MNRSMKSNSTSLGQMVEKGELVYDFDTTSIKNGYYEKNRIGKVLKEYSGCFDSLLLNRGDSHLWVRCSILRMKVNNLLLERLLRDLRKRCTLHIHLLSGALAEFYEKRAEVLEKVYDRLPAVSRLRYLQWGGSTTQPRLNFIFRAMKQNMLKRWLCLIRETMG